jgi:hypothetical protein
VIAEPLNDLECLSQMTQVARDGTTRADMKGLAARFDTTKALAAWIRSLPQRDDGGDAADGPRVACDVSQRARLAPGDPNCVERGILYLAAAELIDARPVRQLATIDINARVRHTFPLEDGEPVVLDPTVPRNALRAGAFQLRNGAACCSPDRALRDPASLLLWLADLAEDETEASERIARARRALARLLGGRPITPRDRADVLFMLQLAGEVASWFGASGTEGYRAARAHVARLVARGTIAAGRNARQVDLERVAYWGGKAVATYYGLGGAYDAAYSEVKRRPREQPKPKHLPATVVVTVAANAQPTAPVVGVLGELQPKEGSESES